MTAAKVVMYVPLKSKADESWIVHPELRVRIVEDATERGVSLGDVVNSILAEKYAVPYETTPRKTTPEPGKDHLRFDMPVALNRKIESRCRRPFTVNDAVRVTLSAHYGLPVPPRQRRRRTRASA